MKWTSGFPALLLRSCDWWMVICRLYTAATGTGTTRGFDKDKAWSPALSVSTAEWEIFYTTLAQEVVFLLCHRSTRTQLLFLVQPRTLRSEDTYLRSATEGHVSDIELTCSRLIEAHLPTGRTSDKGCHKAHHRVLTLARFEFPSAQHRLCTHSHTPPEWRDSALGSITSGSLF